VKATILAIGDEIVGGLTIDTNSGFLSQLLRGAGVEVDGFVSVPDEEPLIERALRFALARADLVVTTGGLGPTADDLTTACVSTLAQRPLELHESSLRAIEQRFRDRGVEMPPNNRKQAMMPAGAEVLPNPDGTAPGFICPVEVDGRRAHIASFPGVPREMRGMAEASLIPWVVRAGGGQQFGSRVFSTFGLSESRLDELLEGAISPTEARVSFRAAFPRLQVRLNVSGGSADEVDQRLNELDARVRDRLGKHIYAVGDEGMEETVGRLLRQRGLTLALAESCTGGLIGHRITDVPGSSEYLLLGIVAYSNEAKRSLLHVPPDLIEVHGAVSEETVLAMARGAREAAGADIGLATSGIAGPGGGSPDKPVGTVCIALKWEGGEWAKRFQLGERSRGWVKEMTAQIALDRLRRLLIDTF
jgi:nicotinamide-nucleotide amidase